MIKTKYKKALGIIICIIYVFYSICPYIELESDASSALDVYAPSVSIGQPLPQGFSILDISNFLSHVLDSAAGGVKKNLGYIWNRIVDSGYCPGDTQTHRHSFIYGLTSTSLTADLQQPQEGYYCYCEKCGQLAGNLITQYIADSNIDNNGNVTIYPGYTFIVYRGGLSSEDFQVNNIYIYGNDFSEDLQSIGTGNITYGNGFINGVYSLKRGWIGLGFGFDIEELNLNNIKVYWNYYRRTQSGKRPNNANISENMTYNPPVESTYNIGSIDSKLLYVYSAWGTDTIKSLNDTAYYNDEYICYLYGSLPEENLNDNYNYDNIQSPIAYINNGTLIYGGYSSSIVNTDTMIYTDPSTGSEYEIDSMEYDYSTNTYTLDISDFLNGVTVEFGVDGIKINENGQDKQFFYITNPLTPVNPVTNVGTGTGLVNLDGTINLTVNQVSSNTNAYITTNEDIPQGLRALRETLATMFVELPEMTGEVTDFMQEGFSYIPQEVTTLIIFGVSVAVFVGLFKLFWR